MQSFAAGIGADKSLAKNVGEHGRILRTDVILYQAELIIAERESIEAELKTMIAELTETAQDEILTQLSPEQRKKLDRAIGHHIGR